MLRAQHALVQVQHFLRAGALEIRLLLRVERLRVSSPTLATLGRLNQMGVGGVVGAEGVGAVLGVGPAGAVEAVAAGPVFCL